MNSCVYCAYPKKCCTSCGRGRMRDGGGMEGGGEESGGREEWREGGRGREREEGKRGGGERRGKEVCTSEYCVHVCFHLPDIPLPFACPLPQIKAVYLAFFNPLPSLPFPPLPPSLPPSPPFSLIFQFTKQPCDTITASAEKLLLPLNFCVAINHAQNA